MKTTYVIVGMRFRATEALVDSLPTGEPLTLIREPTNNFDPFAVQVWARGVHLGYVRASQVQPLAEAMDAAAPAPRKSLLGLGTRLATATAMAAAPEDTVGTLLFSPTHRIPHVEVEDIASANIG